MRKNLFKKTAIILSIVVLIGCAMIGTKYISSRNTSNESINESQTISISIIVEGRTKDIKVKEGLSVMEIMNENYDLQTQYDGTFISGIDEVVADESNFIAFNINGEMSMVGASEYYPAEGDNIEFRLTPLQ